MYSLANALFDIEGAAVRERSSSSGARMVLMKGCLQGDGNTIRVYVNDRSILVHEVDDMGADDQDVRQPKIHADAAGRVAHRLLVIVFQHLLGLFEGWRHYLRCQRASSSKPSPSSLGSFAYAHPCLHASSSSQPAGPYIQADSSDDMSLSFDVVYGLGPALTPDTADGGIRAFAIDRC